MTTTHTFTECPYWCERHDTHADHCGTVAKGPTGDISLMQFGDRVVINPPVSDYLTPDDAREMAAWLTAAAAMAEREALA